VKPRRGSVRLATLLGSPPSEVLAATCAPRGADGGLSAIERGMRTAAAIDVVPRDWHWPRWLDRQLRPEHPAYVARGDAPIVENVTGRDWRYVGTVSSGWLAMVDPRGVVVPIEGGWSLDWLVRADDRWHRPAREAAVRQKVRGGCPVPETACRVPGGDVLQRVYGATTGGSLGDVVVVEVENPTAAPIAVAFAVRPVDLLGVGSITSIALDDTRVLLDGRLAMLFERKPARVASGNAATDSIAAVTADTDDEELDSAVRDAMGLANACFVLPVPHRTTVRVVIPVRHDRRERPVVEAPLPAADAIERGWDAHGERGASFELPDDRITGIYAAAVRNLLLATGDGAVVPPHGREDRWSVADEAGIVRSLHQCGMNEAADAVLRRRGDEFELDGWFRREGPSLARNAAIFEAVGDAWALSRDRLTVDAVLGPVVKAAHWSERYRSRRTRTITNADAYAMHDALLVLAQALVGVEQPEAAQDVAAFAARFVLDHDPAPTVTDDDELPVVSPRGLDTVATVERAIRLARRRDERAMVAIGWLSEVAGERGRWPTYVHPRFGTGCGGSGDDPIVSAAIVTLVRSLAVQVDGHAVVLLPMVPAAWLGHQVDVRDVPTAHGRCSFSVRWHGERPALLWEVAPWDVDTAGAATRSANQPITITAPGLDPSFRTSDLSGEALLERPAATAHVPARPGASFG
jgi:hypothetical protein